MTHLDKELQTLKDSILEMWNLNQLQFEKTIQSFQSFDKDLAREILANEKRVNAFELKIDRECENVFALFNPVAIDLRFVLAVLKINSSLERMGDMSEGIAKFVIDMDHPFEEALLRETKIKEMFDLSSKMFNDIEKAFEDEDTKLARTIFKNDEMLDILNSVASDHVAEYIKTHPENIKQALHVLSIIRKLERVGDYCKNIAEEIIFYIEAKVLKHNQKLKKGK